MRENEFAAQCSSAPRRLSSHCCCTGCRFNYISQSITTCIEFHHHNHSIAIISHRQFDHQHNTIFIIDNNNIITTIINIVINIVCIDSAVVGRCLQWRSYQSAFGRRSCGENVAISDSNCMQCHT